MKKNKISLIKKFITIISIITIFFTIMKVKTVSATNQTEAEHTDMTRVYFSAEMTRGHGQGDLILLENYDKNGKKVYGLIDAGIAGIAPTQTVIQNDENENENENDNDNNGDLKELENETPDKENENNNSNNNSEQQNNENGVEIDNPEDTKEEAEDEGEIEEENIAGNVNEVENNIYNNAALKYLNDHGVTSQNGLEFFLITHQHPDHNGNAVAILDYLNGNVKTMYMKETDKAWTNDNITLNGTAEYYKIIKKVIDYNIPVVGMSYLSTQSKIISPTLGYIKDSGEDYFKEYREYFKQNADIDKFTPFSKKNINFNFGSSKIKIVNWEIFDTEGKIITIDDKNKKIIKDGISYTIDQKNYNREIKTHGENGHSLGIVLTQGNKKAFMAGDMNNYAETKSGDSMIGTETRLANEIGDIDFYKPSHHGLSGSNNIENFVKRLKPEYMVITNDVGGALKDLIDYIHNNNVQYLYNTADLIGVSATLTDNEVYLGFETPGERKTVDGKQYYLPPKSIYKKDDDYTNYLYEIKYSEKQYINGTKEYVENWDELNSAIQNNKIEIEEILKSGRTINQANKTIIFPKLVINLKNETNFFATSTCKINELQNIVLNTTNNVNITRSIDSTGKFFKYSVFYVKNGYLKIGQGITIDGNKSLGSACRSLVTVDEGTVYLYGKICNNYRKAATTENRTEIIKGSGISCENSGKIYMYEGATISNNSQLITATENEPTYKITKTVAKSIEFNTYGAGISLDSNSTLKMYGGEICENIAKNGSVIQNADETIKNNKKVYQDCYGVGISALGNSKIEILGGKIHDNRALNFSKFKLTNDTANIKTLYNRISGIGIYANSSELIIKKDTKDIEIYNNRAKFENEVSIKNEKQINQYVRKLQGGQVFCGNKSRIDANGINIYYNLSEVSMCQKEQNIPEKISINNIDIGAGIAAYDTTFDINHLTLNGCKSRDAGGGIYLWSNCNGTISNSVINKNTAKANAGGGIYVSSNCSLTLKKTEVSENKAGLSGGGIYNKGKVIVDGSTSKINQNSAQKNGGGVLNSKDGGILAVINGQIQENTAVTGQGGGIYNDSGTLYKGNSISIINNTAPNGNQEGKEIYPTDNSIKDTKAPSLKITGIPTNYIRDKFNIMIESDDNLGVKSVKLNEKTITTNGTYNYEISSNDTYKIVVEDYFGNKKEETKTINKIVMSGDANSDNVVDINDILQMNKHRLKKLTLQEKEKVAADLNDDGNVDIFDMFKLNKYRLNKINSL